MPIILNFNKITPSSILRVIHKRGKSETIYSVTAEKFIESTRYPVVGSCLKNKLTQAHRFAEFDDNAQITITEEHHAPLY